MSSPSVNSYDNPRTPEIDEFVDSSFHPLLSNFNQSPILMERALNTDTIDHWGQIRIDAGEWHTFIKEPRGRVNVSLVREFYTSLSGATSVDSTFFVNLRGYAVPFSSGVINQMYQIPDFQVLRNPHFEFEWDLENMDNYITRYTEACGTLFLNPRNMNGISTNDLLPHLIPWKRFINSRVYPTENFMEILDTEMLLLHALVSGFFVDWGVLIHKAAVNFAMNRMNVGRPLPFAWLITKICKQIVRMEDLETDEFFPSRVPTIGMVPVEVPGCSF